MLHAQARIAQGLDGPHPNIIPGVVSYNDYLRREATWDEIKKTIRLYGHFYLGAEVFLYPPQWLDRAEAIAESLKKTNPRRKAKAMGVDAAEGGDSTCWAITDELGLLRLVSLKTQDTSGIPGRTLALMEEYQIPPEAVCFDRGGGGKQHADILRKRGYRVRTVGFGETVTLPDRHKAVTTANESTQNQEKRYVYKNRRAEMYGLFRNLLNPEYNEAGFGIPARYRELRRQLAPIPLFYDGEGRLYLPPKDKPSPGYTGITLKQLLGCSPDEADSVVLAIFGMLVKSDERVVRAV